MAKILLRAAMMTAIGFGLAACDTSPTPTDFSHSVKTDSGVNATGSAGAVGGAGAAVPGTGAVSKTTTP